MNKIPILSHLTTDDVDSIIDDLDAERRGIKTYYAVDTFELFDFCYPINPSSLHDVDIDQLADEQAAIYELIYVREERPVLLTEYQKELRGLLYYFGETAKQASDRTAILGDMIKAGGLEQIAADSRNEFEKIVKEDFGVILATTMGIYSVGAYRLRDILNNRITDKPLPDSPRDKEVIEEIFANITVSELSKIISDELDTAPESSSADLLSVELSGSRRHKNNIIDADAIDRIIQINAALQDAYRRGGLSKEYRLLYFSGADRTRRVFRMPAIQNAVNAIRGQPWRLYRTRAQIFAYVVHKSHLIDGSARIDYDRSIINLRELRKIVSEISTLYKSDDFWSEQCDECPIKKPSDSLVNLSNCHKTALCVGVANLTKRIEAKRNEVENLGLVNTVDDYKRLLEAHAHSDLEKKSVALFRRISESPIKDFAMDAMKLHQEWILLNADITNLFLKGLSKREQRSQRFKLRSGKDKITGVDQYLPTKPQLSSSKFRAILDGIVTYYISPSRDDLLENAYYSFMDLSANQPSVDGESELVRCYLYLAFGGGDDIERAYSLARASQSRAALMAPNEEMEREFNYVMCWAARRIGKFDEAHRIASSGLERWPEDARFWHGRCLNTYSWLIHPSTEPRSVTIDDAIADAEQAIKLYESDKRNADVVAANYNNLAYFYAWKVRNNQFDLKTNRHVLDQSRAALKELERVVDKAHWDPQHPEYFHTEAYLEYAEFLMLSPMKRRKAELDSILRRARRAIVRATSIYPEGPEYQELLDEISQARSKRNHP
ncbi:MAG: hypothetical protein V7638_1635 [Acidobacteriota bacterium]|jgi:hypothetical protein